MQGFEQSANPASQEPEKLCLLSTHHRDLPLTLGSREHCHLPKCLRLPPAGFVTLLSNHGEEFKLLLVGVAQVCSQRRPPRKHTDQFNVCVLLSFFSFFRLSFTTLESKT